MDTILNLNQAQRLSFVMVDVNSLEISGLVGALTIEVSKDGGVFAPSAGAQGEIGSGWYWYLTTAGETDTVGPLSIRINGAGCVQQNLVYFVQSAISGAIAFTYTVTNNATGLPIEGVEVWITTDIAGSNIIWKGDTDAFGVARDDSDNLPYLDTGTYFFFRQKAGFLFIDPDQELVD